MTPPSNGQALGFRSRGVDPLYWRRADMDGRIPGMEAFVARAGHLGPRLGRAGQARALCAHAVNVVVSGLAELLAAT
jgi:hypothetical protein